MQEDDRAESEREKKIPRKYPTSVARTSARVAPPRTHLYII